MRDVVTNYETINLKHVKAAKSRHSGQAKRDPESRISRQFLIPAFAGMTE